jgi:hypothetical protein
LSEFAQTFACCLLCKAVGLHCLPQHIIDDDILSTLQGQELGKFLVAADLRTHASPVIVILQFGPLYVHPPASQSVEA